MTDDNTQHQSRVHEILSNDPELTCVASFQGAYERVYCGFKTEREARNWLRFNESFAIMSSGWIHKEKSICLQTLTLTR